MHLSPLCHLAMFTWPLFCVWAFRVLSPRQAVSILCVMGYCFLPQVLYDLPGPLDYGKDTAISLGMLIGLFWTDRNAWSGVRWGWMDLPMFVWCTCCIMSSLTNGLGLYDGVAMSLSRVTTWGACYLAGRAVFRKLSDFNDAFHAIVVGGLCYVPFCMFEMRMSPRLNQMLYGFTTEKLFMENFRYGGWRPGVFMNHGITTALWMGTSATAALVLWLFAGKRRALGLPMGLAVMILFPTFLFSRSAGAWVVIFIIALAVFAATMTRKTSPFAILMGVIPAYLLSRILATVDLGWIDDLVRSNTMRLTWTLPLLISIGMLLCLDRRQLKTRFAFAIVPTLIAAALLLLPLNNTWLLFAGLIGIAGMAAAARSWWPAIFMLLAIPVYHLDIPWLLDVTGMGLGAERAGSLLTRITNENAMIAHILKQPIFGWGTGMRFLPTGKDAASVAIDSFWPVPLGTDGTVGMIAVYLLIVGLPMMLALSLRPTGTGLERKREWAGLTGCLACLGAGALYTLSAGYAFPVYQLLLGGTATMLAERFHRPDQTKTRSFARRERFPSRIENLGLLDAAV